MHKLPISTPADSELDDRDPELGARSCLLFTRLSEFVPFLVCLLSNKWNLFRRSYGSPKIFLQSLSHPFSHFLNMCLFPWIGKNHWKLTALFGSHQCKAASCKIGAFHRVGTDLRRRSCAFFRILWLLPKGFGTWLRIQTHWLTGHCVWGDPPTYLSVKSE